MDRGGRRAFAGEARDFEERLVEGAVVIRLRSSWSAWQRACVGHWIGVCQACRAETWLCDLGPNYGAVLNISCAHTLQCEVLGPAE